MMMMMKLQLMCFVVRNFITTDYAFNEEVHDFILHIFI